MKLADLLLLGAFGAAAYSVARTPPVRAPRPAEVFALEMQKPDPAVAAEPDPYGPVRSLKPYHVPHSLN